MADVDSSRVIVSLIGPETTWANYVQDKLIRAHGFSLMMHEYFAHHEPEPYTSRMILTDIGSPSDLHHLRRRPDTVIVMFGGAATSLLPSANAVHAAAGTREELGVISAQVFQGDEATLQAVVTAITSGVLLSRVQQAWYGFEMPAARLRRLQTG